MKLLWLCNNAPGLVRSHLSGKPESGVNWVDHVLKGLLDRGFTVRILYRGAESQGVIDTQCSYAGISETPAHIYQPQLEALFCRELREFQPDVIHSWGVEYNHALSMVKAAEQEGMLPRMAASMQGLASLIAGHYNDGVPVRVQRSATFRDLVRKDNLLQQQEKMAQRGAMEVEALGKLRHVIGRTRWDKAGSAAVNPEVHYHFCNETLRENFYQGQWQYETCKKHRIFVSSCSYPVKGFHYLLEAVAQVAKTYPDVTISVTGRSFLTKNIKEKLRMGSYEAYLAKLAKKYGLEEKIEFLGSLSAEAMKDAFLEANVFALPSTIENSPNSLGEAMLLGLPCVAADVGGVADLMEDGTEGRIYAPGDVDALAGHIQDLFAMEDRAEALGQAARAHALKTHDPEKNLNDLIEIYNALA